jgi:hypothetical protein
MSAKVRSSARLVGVEDDAQRDVGEVVALGHHLGTDEHAGRRGLKALERPGALGQAGGVGVEAEDREGPGGVRSECLAQLVLDALGPGAVARH